MGHHPARGAQRDQAPVAGHRPRVGLTPARRAVDGLGRPHPESGSAVTTEAARVPDLPGLDRGARPDLPSAPAAFRQLSQGRLDGLNAVGVGVGVAGPRQPHDQLSGSALSVVDEIHQRVVAELLPPRRGRAPTCRSARTPARRPGPRLPTRRRPVPAFRPTLPRTGADLAWASRSAARGRFPPDARVSISRETVGSEATRPNTAARLAAGRHRPRSPRPARPRTPHLMSSLDADTRVEPVALLQLESASDECGNKDLISRYSRWPERCTKSPALAGRRHFY